ncbi:hypothetical protein BY457_104224 [Marinilabilia salmonicolor]|uniref:hypothetical protein n=1 Tax=Marinilabilia salmonicolor TaxID=989 RepID=UPI000D4533C0|nr:hypothetical protein [Marinilabilia salmonicolor]PRZ01024.1 hypothetical protein BY457_104224 [Marinilabilia salmonicolor]
MIHNPENVLLAHAESEEEGAYGSADWTSLVEGIRCARYNGKNSLNINNLDAQIRQSTLTWNNPRLLDNEPYGNTMLKMDYDDISTIDISNITVQGHKVYIGKPGDQIHFEVRNGNKYDSPELAEKFQQYLAVDATGFESKIEALCLKMDGMSSVGTQFKKLPSCYYSRLSLERRADYIEKLASDCEANLGHILELINSLPKVGNSVLKLFSSLNSKPNISKALYQKSEWANKDRYTSLVRAFTLLFYKNILKENIKGQVTQNHLFKWYKATDFNVYYNTSLNPAHQIEFSADIEYLKNNGNEREKVEYEIPIGIPAFSVVGVDFKTKVDFIGVEGQIFPMPAFYFNWMVHEYNRIEMAKAVNVSIYALSFCFGVGEIAAAQKTWKAAVALAGIVHASGKLYFQFNDEAVAFLQENTRGQEFLAVWNSIGNVLTAVDVTDNVLHLKFSLFVTLTMAWDNLSEEEKMKLQELMGEEYDDLITIINTSIR